MHVRYSPNNSGGSWWLTDQNWHDLEAAGWNVRWVKDEPEGLFHRAGEDRWLGALAKEATREGLTLGDAIEEWERVTGENSTDLGCSCCGQPHAFYLEDDEGNTVEWYTPEYPRSGERYGR